MKIIKVPPLRCKDCASTRVINDYSTITCDDCGLIDGKGKILDRWKPIGLLQPQGNKSRYWRMDDEDDEQ